MQPSETVHNRRRLAAGVFVVATTLGLLAVGQQWIGMRNESDPISFWRLAALAMPFWYWWMALTPLVVWMSRRLPLERHRLLSRVLTHMALAIVLAACHSVLHTTTVILLQRWLGGPGLEGGLAAFLSITFFEMSMNFLAYSLIVGVTHALTLYRTLREREVMAADLAERLTRARLDVLRMQLNPHFLFNAMNAVSSLVRQEHNQQAIRVIAGLSDLLRYVLEESREQEVPLRDELSFVERYLKIEQVRFGKRLTVHIHRPDDLLDSFVPSLVLQPLVENAIRHGVSKHAGAGTITIAARSDDGILELSVRDDGPGYDTDDPPDGVGIGNTKARLERLYASDQSFRLANCVEGGVEATIRLPYHTQPVGGDREP
jgi:signal transduction histidine kinase